MVINTDKSYLLGLLVGGGMLHENSLQIILPYKKWGNLQVNPKRAGGIAEDILKRLNPIFTNHYKMQVSYKVGQDWKIVSDPITDLLKNDLAKLGLPTSGELRYTATIDKLMSFLTTIEHKKRFITGLVDTVGSLAVSHRRFTSEFQIISFEFKGCNFQLVKNVIEILQSIECIPDQVLWNHPNQHSGKNRYYKSWKKGFKIRVALDTYLLKGGFVFSSKKLSAQENISLQKSGGKSSNNKPIKVTGRVTLHKEEYNNWLPTNIRGGHYIHNLHFYSVLGIKIPYQFDIKNIISHFEKYFCPFTCITKGEINEVEKIIHEEEYLRKSVFIYIRPDIKNLLELYRADSSALLFGNTKKDGFPVSYILEAVAYIIAATLGLLQGKRTRIPGQYIPFVENNCSTKTYDIKIGIPDRGTCMLVKNNQYAVLIGYVNDEFNKTLVYKIEDSKVYLTEPVYEECVKL